MYLLGGAAIVVVILLQLTGNGALLDLLFEGGVIGTMLMSVSWVEELLRMLRLLT